LKRYPIIKSGEAAEDLIEIWAAISAKNPPAADSYLHRLQRRMDVLETMPERGVPRYDLLPALRMLVEGNYLIFYRFDGTKVDILRVLHGARDLTNFFA
jgi:toxin ParE1/3/4